MKGPRRHVLADVREVEGVEARCGEAGQHMLQRSLSKDETGKPLPDGAVALGLEVSGRCFPKEPVSRYRRYGLS